MDKIISPQKVSRSNQGSKLCQWSRRKTDRRLISPYTTLDNNSNLTGHDLINNVLNCLEYLANFNVYSNVNTVMLKGINDKPKEIKELISFLKNRTNRITFLKPVNTPNKPEIVKKYLPDLKLILRILDDLCEGKTYKYYKNKDRAIVYSFGKLNVHIRDTLYNFDNNICKNCKYLITCTEGIIHPRMNMNGKIFPCLFREDLSIDLKKLYLYEGEEKTLNSLKTYFEIFNNDIDSWVVGWKR